MTLMNKHTTKLSIAVSSRALFNMDQAHQIYEQQGIKAYEMHQLEHEKQPLPKGVAFNLVKKLLALNRLEGIEVSIMLISRNSADTGLCILNSIEHYELDITRASFTNGASPYPYIKAFNAHLFLSANEYDVRESLDRACPAARILKAKINEDFPDQLRIAFDGDAVLFSDDSEKIYQRYGLKAFAHNEKKMASNTLKSGPFKTFLDALCAIQHKVPEASCPIRTALVTARSAPAHERVILTLRAWGIRLDEALFLGGLKKGEFLEAFGADIFFDDQPDHCSNASEHVTTGHVPHGIMNEAIHTSSDE